MGSDEEDLDPEVIDAWLRSEVVPANDTLKADPSRAVPIEDVRRHFEDKWSQRCRRTNGVD